jgi:serine/threonine protein kinase
MKILTAHATARVVKGVSLEYDAYRKVGSTNPNSPGFGHSLTLRHCFISDSAAGGHICFVTDVLSSSLASLRPRGQNRFTVAAAKRIIKQVLLALDYLHRECGYIHTGESASVPVLLRANDHTLRHQIRQHPCHDTPTGDRADKPIHLVKPSINLWSPRRVGIITPTSHLLAFGTPPVLRPWWIV